MTKTFVIAALITGAVSSELKANQPTSAPATVLQETKRMVDRPDERVSVLNNGLTVILKAHRTAPVVSVRMYCRTGSIYEQEYLGSGMSHLFEHLLHGSETTTRSEEESRKMLDDIGGNTNAYTSLDVTCYYISTLREHTNQAIHLLGDWITRPTFPQEAFDREWGVVQRELERDADNPDRQLFYLTMETMYRKHPARYPIIGHKPIVQKLTKEDIVSYYQRMYVPDNIVVCIVGDIDIEQTLAKIKEEFASFQRKRVPTITLPAEPEMATPRFACKRMKVQSAILRLSWPAIPLTHPDLYALDILSYVLTQGNSSRLVKTIRDQGLTFSIDSFSWTPDWGRGTFAITARLDPAKIEQATSAIKEQIEILQHELITPAELQQAKQQKAAEQVFASQTAESIAGMMASDYLSTGDVHFSQAYVDNIQKVTAEQTREMARKYLLPQRLATITILPEDYQPPAGQEAETSTPDPVRKIVLDNGLRVLIRRDPTTPLVAMQSFSFGGVLFEDEHTNGLSHLAALLAPRGTATRDAQQIARFFDSRGGYLSGSSGYNTIFVKAEVLKDDFAEAFEVFADVVVQPTFPKQELEIYRPRVLDQIRRVNESWRSELFAYFRSRFFKHSPYRFKTIGSEEVVAKATREDIAEFYRQRVNGAQTVLAVFGDVDPEEVESLVRKHFEALPAAKQPTPDVPEEPSLNNPVLYIKSKSPTRQAAGIEVGFRGMKFTNTEDTIPVAVLDTIISGYRYPTGWLHESLRGGQQSLVYEVHAQNIPGILPGLFAIYAACQPDKVNEVYQIISKQLEKARSGECTAEEIKRDKAIIVTSELMGNQTNSARAMQAALDELYGLGYDYREQFSERINRVTAEDVQRVAKKYFTTPVIAVVTPAPDQVDLGIEPTAVDSDESDNPPESK